MRTSSVGIAAILLLAPAGAPSGGQAAEGGPSRAAAVTSLGGPSWLRSLAITVDETKLGHMGGAGPAPASPRAAAFDEDVRRAVALAGSNDAAARASLQARVTADGADIYRLECRSCHGPDGRGEPPEVGSIVGLVRALSPALLEENMRKAGRPVRSDLAGQLAKEAEKSLAERLRDGGKRMPPFRYLSDAERDALVRYLKHLAGVPSAMAEQVEVAESPARLGELLVQGTCRICHDATGPGGGHMMMMMADPGARQHPRAALARGGRPQGALRMERHGGHDAPSHIADAGVLLPQRGGGRRGLSLPRLLPAQGLTPHSALL